MLKYTTYRIMLKRSKVLNIKVNTVKPVYRTVTLGKWLGDRYIQGDRYMQVSFKIYSKLMTNIFMCMEIR